MGFNRRYKWRIKPAWAATLGGMADHKSLARASCRKCHASFKVDVDLLIHKFGRDYSLYDKIGVCRLSECDGQCFFLGSPQKGTAYFPLFGDEEE